MSNASEQARRDANNGKSGVPPSGYSKSQQEEYKRIFAEQQSKNKK